MGLFSIPKPTQDFAEGMMLPNQIDMQESRNALLQSKAAMAPFQTALIQAQLEGMPIKNALNFAKAKQAMAMSSPEYMNSLINWRNALSGTMPVRALSPTGKTIVEQAYVQGGLAPTGQQFNGLFQPPATNVLNQPLSLSNNDINKLGDTSSPIKNNITAPAPMNELSDQYGLLRQKQTTDTQVRNRNLYATNIEKTLDRIDPTIFAYYTGPEGAMRFAKDKALGLANNGKDMPSELKAYQRIYKVDVPVLSKQIRQFYGDSIQPIVAEKLNAITNPDSWDTNPQLALEQFDELKALMAVEIETYRDALKSTAIYKGNNKKNISIDMSSYSTEQLRQIAQGN